VVDKVALGQIFSKYFTFPLSVSFHRCSVFILNLLVALIRTTNGRSLVTSQKSVFFWKWEAFVRLVRKRYCVLFRCRTTKLHDVTYLTAAICMVTTVTQCHRLSKKERKKGKHENDWNDNSRKRN
jgi:hypothetical protein